MNQHRLPYHIEGVKSNDDLFSATQTYTISLNFCNYIFDKIMEIIEGSKFPTSELFSESAFSLLSNLLLSFKPSVIDDLLLKIVKKAKALGLRHENGRTLISMLKGIELEEFSEDFETLVESL